MLLMISQNQIEPIEVTLKDEGETYNITHHITFN